MQVPKGRDQVSGGVSVPCWHATPVADALWKPIFGEMSDSVIMSSPGIMSKTGIMSNRCRMSLVSNFSVALFVLSLYPFDISVGVGAFVIGLGQISSFFSQQVEQKGQDQVSGGVSVPCRHATPVANVLWKPLEIR